MRANIGVTCFRGAAGPLDFIPAYYATARWTGFTHFVAAAARTHGITIHSNVRVAGVWQGQCEPAVSLDVTGTDAGIHAFCAALGARYNQDAVLLYVAGAGADTCYTLEHVDPALALAALTTAGIDGGRLCGDRLETLGADPTAVATLAGILGTTVQTATGTLEFIARGTDY